MRLDFKQSEYNEGAALALLLYTAVEDIYSQLSDIMRENMRRRITRESYEPRKTYTFVRRVKNFTGR